MCVCMHPPLPQNVLHLELHDALPHVLQWQRLQYGSADTHFPEVQVSGAHLHLKRE